MTEYNARKDGLESYNLAIDMMRNEYGTSRKIALPFPPPLSACFVNVSGRGRVASKRYKAWTLEALWEIKLQRVKSIHGAVNINVQLVAPDSRARDAGNLDKAICDVLVKAGIIADDSNRYIRKISYEWFPVGPPCTVLIEPVGEKNNG